MQELLKIVDLKLNYGPITALKGVDLTVPEGQIVAILGANGAIADAEECAEHFHLKCIRCGKLIHVDCAYLGELGEHIGAHHGFKVDRSKTVFYGTCGACLEK